MSQVGNIISCCSWTWCSQVVADWSVLYTYQLDAGGTAQAGLIVGSGANPSPWPQVALWASPTSTITVSPNPPGTTNPVLLLCPDIVKRALFGIPYSNGAN